MVEVVRGPGRQQGDEFGVQWDVAVVAELAERDPQPVPVTDEHDGVRVEVGQFAGPHAGPGEQFDDQPVTIVGAGACRGHQLGGVAVVEEPRQRLGLFGDVAGDHGVADRGIGPVPLDDPLEERPHGPHPLPVRLDRQPALGAGLPGQPELVVLDVVASQLRDGGEVGRGGHPPSELTQRVLGRLDALGCQKRLQPQQIPPHRGPDVWCCSAQFGPLGVGHRTGRRSRGGRRRAGCGAAAHRAVTSWTAIMSATAAVSASINAAARRYSAANQSLVRCR